jgi:hypothetical protein
VEQPPPHDRTGNEIERAAIGGNERALDSRELLERGAGHAQTRGRCHRSSANEIAAGLVTWKSVPIKQ